jgi:hypothetical protein
MNPEGSARAGGAQGHAYGDFSTRDHGPAHVHLVSPEARIKVWLNCPSGPLEPYEARGVTKATLRRLLETLEPNLNQFCSEWRKVHGDL